MAPAKKSVSLTATNDDEQFVAFYLVADGANSHVHETLAEITPLGSPGRQNVSLHWWTVYLGTLLDEMACASANLLLLDSPRAAIVTIRQVFEYSIRTQSLHAHPAEAERLTDSMQKLVSKEAQLAPRYFSAELREQYARNYRTWADQHPELDVGNQQKAFTVIAREVLGPRFDAEFFRQYAYPSIIAHGKPHGMIDVLNPVGIAQAEHSWNSRTIDVLSELSKLASTVIEYIAFVRSKYGLNISKAFELNERHGAIQEQFGYARTTPSSNT